MPQRPTARRPLSLLVLAATSLLGTFALADAPIPGPKDLMREVFSRAAWKDMHATVALTLRTARGDTRERSIEMWSKKNAKAESSMLMRFVAPADVRGTGFLLIEHEGADDDRRLFLPALRRVTRISASGSGGAFMSSDFTYYDVGRPELDDWSYQETAIPTDKRDHPLRVIEGTPKTPQVASDTGYGRIVWQVDPVRRVVLAADYFDKAGMALKHLEATRFEDVGGVPFATEMTMTDAQTKHASTMRFEDIATDQGLDDAIFTERNLRRWTR